jgi:hypothetical protein
MRPFHLALAITLIAAAPLQAQRQSFAATGMQVIGVHAAWDATGKALGVGLQARLPVTAKLDLAPSGDLFFKDNGTWGQLNLDLIGSFQDASTGNYFGIGASVVRSGGTATTPNSTHFGPDFVLGVTSTHPGTLLARPFFEARWTVVEGRNPFQLMAGLNFRFF